MTIARIQVKHTWVLKEWNISLMQLRLSRKSPQIVSKIANVPKIDLEIDLEIDPKISLKIYL